MLMKVGLSEEDENLPYHYWTSEYHKKPFKHCFITGSIKYTTKMLSCCSTKMPFVLKDYLIGFTM